MSDVLIVGAGLLGTSLGLALSPSRRVALHDTSPAHLATAVAMGAGHAWDGRTQADIVLLAVPPAAIAHELLRLRRLDLGKTYTHIGSVQSQVQREVESRIGHAPDMLGCHPMAGRETTGPAGASADLFSGRRWAVCPWAGTSDHAVDAVIDLARACRAEPVLLGAVAHDEAVALSSHLPHLTSALLAGLLVEATDEALALAGPGLTDMTRLAGGDPALWREILTINRQHVADVAHALGTQLTAASQLIASGDAVAVSDLLERGRRGRARIPGKHGRRDVGFERVTVVLRDAPGELARLLGAAAAAAINIEDVRVEHAVGEQTGWVGLWVAAADRPRLGNALESAGWSLGGA